MSEPLQYDPAVIQKCAKKLNFRVAVAFIVWPLAGIAIAYFIIPRVIPVNRLWIVGVFGALLGYLYGSYRANLFRLKAQEALCLVKIEENTRNRTT